MNVLRARLLANGRLVNAVPATPATRAAVVFPHSFVRRHVSGPPVSWEDPEVDPQLNGYPQLPAVSHQHRPPYGWDDAQERRNIGEPLHEDYDVLSVWAYDHYRIPGSTALREIGIAAIFFSLFAAAVYAVTPERPALPRTYPYSGLVKELGGVEENKALEESLEED
ncbi:uncharacterized protein EI90DRAFT_2966458 [Cantharellus anzutake]|uniref:uncharacterized protein n=1 Tax=Cantharellus anzutake TaxID=1750568 RepID=UPI001907D8BB|nr:uncharacterized protein EI90DRAFT_2966458 [Cantharellus anzutake]KAF8340574.1 hypothetical protein EI90DRAFT_2966458 [Cantharellus anzutake]